MSPLASVCTTHDVPLGMSTTVSPLGKVIRRGRALNRGRPGFRFAMQWYRRW